MPKLRNMASKVFLDANIFLDAFLQRAEQNAALTILKLANAGTITAYTTPAIIHVVSYFLRKEFSNQELRLLLKSLLLDVQIIELDHANTIHALNSDIEDVEDALQYYAALQHRVQVFLSRDKKLGAKGLPQLPVMGAKEFLEISGFQIALL